MKYEFVAKTQCLCILDMNYTTVVYTAAKRYLNGETGAGEDAVPLKIIQYPSNVIYFR